MKNDRQLKILGADFNKSETEVPECRHGVSFFIHAGSQPHAVGELKPHNGYRIINGGTADESRQQMKMFGRAEPCEGDFMRCFRVQTEQKFLG